MFSSFSKTFSFGRSTPVTFNFEGDLQSLAGAGVDLMTLSGTEELMSVDDLQTLTGAGVDLMTLSGTEDLKSSD
jgi:hypothetical protein